MTHKASAVVGTFALVPQSNFFRKKERGILQQNIRPGPIHLSLRTIRLFLGTGGRRRCHFGGLWGIAGGGLFDNLRGRIGLGHLGPQIQTTTV
jgi:hypothetical protein